MEISLDFSERLIAPLFTYMADEIFFHSPEWFKNGRKDIFDVVYMPLEERPQYEFVSYLDEDFWKKALSAFHIEFDKLKSANVVKDGLELILEVKSAKKPTFVQMSNWFGVSDVRSLPSNNPCLGEFKVDDCEYRIIKSTRNKCERCWKRLAEKDLCIRCIRIVRGT